MSEHQQPKFVVPVQGGRRSRDRPGDALGARSPGNSRGEELVPLGSHGEIFRALFEHAPLGVALSSMDGRFQDVNPSLRALLEGTAIDPATGSLDDLAGAPPDGSDAVTAWRQALADVRAGRAAVAGVELTVTPEGHPARWVRVTTALAVLGGRSYLLSHVEDTTGRRLAEDRLERLACHDSLTGLANRSLLEARLVAARASENIRALPTGVLYLDLHELGAVNRELGYETGDAVLVAVARRLTGALRAGDTAGRLGGDAFVVIAPGVSDGTALGELVRRIEAVLAEPLDVGDGRIRIRVTVHGALAGPQESLASVLRRFDPVDLREVRVDGGDLPRR